MSAPSVLAAPGTLTCGERHPSEHGTCCARPRGHAGAHLSAGRLVYWQAARS